MALAERAQPVSAEEGKRIAASQLVRRLHERPIPKAALQPMAWRPDVGSPELGGSKR